MTPPITIVERTARVGILDHDELERLMRDYCDQINAQWQGADGADLTRRMYLSQFLIWLKNKQRHSATIIEGEGDGSSDN